MPNSVVALHPLFISKHEKEILISKKKQSLSHTINFRILFYLVAAFHIPFYHLVLPNARFFEAIFIGQLLFRVGICQAPNHEELLLRNNDQITKAAVGTNLSFFYRP